MIVVRSAVRNLVVLAVALGGLALAASGQANPIEPAADPPAVVVTRGRTAEPSEAPERELVFEGMASFGNYNLFASGSGCKLWTSGVEYDRHTWGYFLRARMDYVAEVLPFVLMEEPTQSDYHGYPTTTQRRLVPGIGVSPIGVRMLWREGRRFQPYVEEKGGMIGFTRKVINANATYENFTLQSSTGVLLRTGSRFDLRLGVYGDFHMSNGFMVATNPGLDVMNANVGLSYELGRPGSAR